MGRTRNGGLDRRPGAGAVGRGQGQENQAAPCLFPSWVGVTMGSKGAGHGHGTPAPGSGPAEISWCGRHLGGAPKPVER